jgi:adenine-specific DNA methylase
LSSIFAFTDIVEVREEKTSNYVIYNDIEKSVSQDVLGALSNYGVKHIPWSEKERCIEEFSIN